MGTHTELVIAIELKQDTPEEVMQTLRYLCSNDAPGDFQWPDHPLFKAERGLGVLCSAYCYSIPGESRATLLQIDEKDADADEPWMLTVRSNIKNYDDEMEKFLDWVVPYSETGSKFKKFVGYLERELHDGEVELIYFDKGKVSLKLILEEV